MVLISNNFYFLHLGDDVPFLTFCCSKKPTNDMSIPRFPKENKSTVIRRFGVGLVIDSTGGLVLTDRYTASRRHFFLPCSKRSSNGRWRALIALQVPQPLVEVELTFGQTVTVNATCLFMHPHHNMASWLVSRYLLVDLSDLSFLVSWRGFAALRSPGSERHILNREK